MSYKARDGNGFTLLEAIIGLGMIAVVGILILQMFMVASRVNTRATDISMAQMIAINTIEERRSSGSMFATDFVEGSQVSVGQSPFVVASEWFVVLDLDEVRLIRYYDADWNPVHLTDVEDEPHSPQNSDAVFKLEFHIGSRGGGFEDDIAGLFDVSIYIWDLRQMDIDNPIVYFYTKLYFPIVGELI